MKFAYALICNDSSFMSHDCNDIVFVCKNKKQLDDIIKRSNFILENFTQKEKTFYLQKIELTSKSKKVIYLKTNDSDLNYSYSNFEHILHYNEENLKYINSILNKMKPEKLDNTYYQTMDIKDSLTHDDITHFFKEYIDNNYLGLEYLSKVKKTGEYYNYPVYHDLKSFRIV